MKKLATKRVRMPTQRLVVSAVPMCGRRTGRWTSLDPAATRVLAPELSPEHRRG